MFVHHEEHDEDVLHEVARMQTRQACHCGSHLDTDKLIRGGNGDRHTEKREKHKGKKGFRGKWEREKGMCGPRILLPTHGCSPTAVGGAPDGCREVGSVPLLPPAQPHAPMCINVCTPQFANLLQGPLLLYNSKEIISSLAKSHHP